MIPAVQHDIYDLIKVENIIDLTLTYSIQGT